MRLVRSKDSFCLMESKTISKYAFLSLVYKKNKVRRTKISPDVLLALAE